MKNWNSVDYVVLILTTIISLVLVITMIKPFVTGIAITDANAKLVAGLIASIISIISMYVGAKIQQNKDK